MPQSLPVYLPKSPAVLTLGFCRGSGIFSRAIEWFGADHYSHVTTLLPDRRHVIDARLHGGVQIRPVSYLRSERVFWVDIGCSSAQQVSALSFLHAQVGKKYDVSGIVDFVTGYAHDHSWRKQTAWFCDELAFAALIAGAIARPPWQPLFRLTPGACAAAVSQLQWKPSDFRVPPP